MSGDFSLTLPVMLAVAIASALSRALSYGTIYTTKLLRRGIDLDEGASAAKRQDEAALPGRVTYRHEADWEHEDPQDVAGQRSVPLPGYYVAEIVTTPDSPAAGRKLGEAGWPTGSVRVSVLRGGSLKRPDRDITLDVGDRVSLLVPALKDAPPPHLGSGGRDRSASLEAGHGSST